MAQRSELMELRMQHRGLLTEDSERTRAILRGDDEGLLAHVGPDLQCGFNRFPEACSLRLFLRRIETDQCKAKARRNMSDAKLRSYATRSAVMPCSPISISATPVSPIRGASRQNRSSLCDPSFIGPCRKKAWSRRLIAPVRESLSCKRSKYLCSDRPSKLPTNGSVNR